MLKQMTLWDINSATGSQESQDGVLHCDSLASRTTSEYGQGLLPASRGLAQAKDSGPPTLAIYGPIFCDSSFSADLQLLLESKLKVALDVNGSRECVLTWSQWPMGWGGQICALRASARPASDSDCTGGQLRLSTFVTPSTRDWKDTPGMATVAKNPDGSTRYREDQFPRQMYGLISLSDGSEVISGGVLNPASSRWCMGFPKGWDEASPNYADYCEVQERIARLG